MGTHPIFESDFDCLTDSDDLKMMLNHNMMRDEKLQSKMPLDRFVWGGHVKSFKRYKQILALFLVLMLIVTNVSWAYQTKYPIWDYWYTDYVSNWTELAIVIWAVFHAIVTLTDKPSATIHSAGRVLSIMAYNG